MVAGSTPVVFVYGKEVDKLCASRCFTGLRHFAVAGQAIDGAGLASVRAPGKGDFRTAVLRALRQFWGTFHIHGASIIYGIGHDAR